MRLHRAPLVECPANTIAQNRRQIPRLDDDQAERCDGNLPFASRLMALLSMTGHWAGQAFVEGEIPFPA
jgi:hypothetical protein